MFFKKKSFFMLVLAAMITMMLAACGGEQTAGEDGEEAYNWTFVTEEMPGEVQYEYAKEFAELLHEKSDGRINMTVYEFGGLGSEVDQVEQLQAGVVQFAIVSPGFTGTMVKEGQIFALHFLLPDDIALTQEILNTSEALNTHLAAKYEEHDIKPLAFFTEGAMQWTGNRELRTPDDFSDFLMRTQTSPLILESYRAYGADPQEMSWGELHGALDNGVVDGQENPIFFIESASFHEVQDHMTISNHNNYVAMTTVNPTFYNGLPEDIRALIDETVEEMRDRGFEIQDELNKEKLESIKNNESHPTEVIELTEEEREAFRQQALPVRDFFLNEVVDEDGKMILEMLQAEIEEAGSN